HPIPSHPIPSIPSHPIPWIPSHPIPSHPIPSHPCCANPAAAVSRLGPMVPRAQTLPLGSRFVPVIVHAGDRPLSSLDFVFYQPQWPNSLAPFCTSQKPFCGFRFQESASHGRRRLGLESTDPVKWRSFHGPKP
uniref:Uncharacterized protein n=1 Tax=Cyanistes caeruleus TaxID=156563 RepID=A0A8C0Z983_CYACU